MKVAYATHYDPCNIKSWSGLGHYIAGALEQQGVELTRLGPLEVYEPLRARLKHRLYPQFTGRQYMAESDPDRLRHFGRQVEEKVRAGKFDAVFTTQAATVAYANCPVPVVLWNDCTFAIMKDFYADYSNLCAASVRNGDTADRIGLQRCARTIFTSEWAAQSAMRDYGVPEQHIRIIPFGANITVQRTAADIEAMLARRPRDVCKLIFIGRIWERKGGDFAVAVAERLNALGLPTDLVLVGSQPPRGRPLPPFVKPAGFISKDTPEGRAKFDQLLGESHFLILPSRAEAFGVVFCEASSFGIPSLATRVGGIPGAVSEGRNGFTFPLDAPVEAWCERIRALMADRAAYDALARTSFAEYQSRLNWQTSGAAAKRVLEEVVGHPHP